MQYEHNFFWGNLLQLIQKVLNSSKVFVLHKSTKIQTKLVNRLKRNIHPFLNQLCEIIWKATCCKQRRNPRSDFSPLQTQYLYFSFAQSSHSGRSALCAPASQSDDSKLMSRANREKSPVHPLRTPISLHTHKTNSSRFRTRSPSSRSLARALPGCRRS